MRDSLQAVCFSPDLKLVSVGWKVFALDSTPNSTRDSQSQPLTAIDVNIGTGIDQVNDVNGSWFTRN